MLKNCRERAKREEEVLLLAEELKTNDENMIVPLVRGLRRLKTYRGKGRGVGTVVGKNCRTRMRSKKTKCWKEFEEYMTSWDPARRRVETLATPIWQLT